MANLSEKGITFEMASFDGGTANNAIPSWAEVVIAVSDKDEAIKSIRMFLDEQKEEFKETDSNMNPEVSETDHLESVLCVTDSKLLSDMAAY